MNFLELENMLLSIASSPVFVDYKVRNGNLVHLWFDICHSGSPILSSYGLQVVYSMGLPLYARLSSVIHGSSWNWPTVKCSNAAKLIHWACSIMPRLGKDIA